MLVPLVPHLLDLYYNEICLQLETVVIYFMKLFFLPSVVSVPIKKIDKKESKKQFYRL